MMKTISLLFLFLALNAVGQDAGALHPWTDLKGRTLQAKFLKADAASVTIDWNGQVFALPLNTLNPESQALASKLGARSKPSGPAVTGIHPWTDLKGRTLQARFLKADATSVTINWNGQVFTLPLNTLQPQSQKLAAKLRAAARPKPPAGSTSLGLEATDPEGELDLSAEQVWTSSDGNPLKGRFVEVNDANLTLSTLGGRREVTIPLSRLSVDSQALAKKLKTLAVSEAKKLAALAKTRSKMKLPKVTEADLDREHDWNSSENQAIKATFVDANDEYVTIFLSDNPTRTFELPWTKFNPTSQALAEALRRKKEEIMPKNPKIIPAKGGRMAAYGSGRFRGYNSIFQSVLYDVALHQNGNVVHLWLKSPGSSRNATDGKRANERPIAIHFSSHYYDRSDPERVRHRHRKIVAYDVSPEPSMDREITTLSGTFDNNGTFEYEMEINHRGLGFWGKLKDPAGEEWPTRMSIGVRTPDVAPEAINMSMEQIMPIIGDGALYIDPIEEKRAKLPFTEKWDDLMRRFKGNDWNPIKSAELMGKPFGSHKIKVTPTNTKGMRLAWGKGYSGVFPFQSVHIGYTSEDDKYRYGVPKNRRLNIFATRGT
ncbi:MAG: hypothetical protein H8E24_07275 [Verrucomicrobia bacterium]|nr:hypothetical protein [Verrucomicrobiota bacterium]